MRITVDNVAKGRDGAVLPPTSGVIESGRVSIFIASGEQAPTVLSLILTGRMRPSSGRLELEGVPNRRALRHHSALVDAPAVSEPVSTVSLESVVREELLFAGEPSGPRTARRWLEAHDLSDVADRPIASLPANIRLAALATLAAWPTDVELVVLTSPTRFGADVEHVTHIAERLAQRGCAVAIVTNESTAELLRAERRAWEQAPPPVDRGTDVDADDVPAADAGLDAPAEEPEAEADTTAFTWLLDGEAPHSPIHPADGKPTS